MMNGVIKSKWLNPNNFFFHQWRHYCIMNLLGMYSRHGLRQLPCKSGCNHVSTCPSQTTAKCYHSRTAGCLGWPDRLVLFIENTRFMFLPPHSMSASMLMCVPLWPVDTFYKMSERLFFHDTRFTKCLKGYFFNMSLSEHTWPHFTQQFRDFL